MLKKKDLKYILTLFYYICETLKKYTMSRINTLLTGTVGAAGVEITNSIPLPEIYPQHGTVSLIIQIVIAVATLFKMFKKPKGA